MQYDEYGTELPPNAELYGLIGAMILDIQQLEIEVVRLRRQLAQLQLEGACTDYFSDLAGYYSEHEVYYEYVENARGGIDPLGEIHDAVLGRALNGESMNP